MIPGVGPYSALITPIAGSLFHAVFQVSGKGVPLWFGGESNPALRRVAEYGDAWIGFNLLPDQAAEKIKRIESLPRGQRT
jgi:hypothetical protein